MRPAELWRRTFARADVQTTLIVCGVIGVAFSISSGAFYARVAIETLEEADRWFDFALRVTEREIQERGTRQLDESSIRSILPDVSTALRVLDPAGRIVARSGDWPPPAREVQARSGKWDLATVLHLDGGDYLVGGSALPSGESVELALPLAHFQREIVEVQRRIVTAGLISVAAALLLGLGATLRAFFPLRRATALLREIDARSLGRRLPSRRTGDPIDVHAETLNRVLEGVDASFDRLRAFSSDAAHELRTPLNRISNVTEVALLGGTERELRTALESVGETTEQLTQIVHSLLLLAEIDDRRFVLKAVPIDVKAWIDRTVDAYAAPFEEAGVELAAHSEPVTLEGDRTLLDRFVANLLDNALAHAPCGSLVEIRAQRRDPEVVVCVDDMGPGVPPGERERVFDRFARLAGSGRRRGHGLGLALARAIVRLHRGELTVGDSALGGARFEARFPVGIGRS